MTNITKNDVLTYLLDEINSKGIYNTFSNHLNNSNDTASDAAKIQAIADARELEESKLSSTSIPSETFSSKACKFGNSLVLACKKFFESIICLFK